MIKMNAELKKIVERLKSKQAQVQNVLADKGWLEDARKFAEKRRKDVKKLFAGDVTKVKAFLEKERIGLEQIQKQLPGEVKKIRKFVDQQKKDLEKMLANVRKASASKSKKKSGTKAKSGTTKKKAAKRTSVSA